ncbi:hypothetical protein AB833_13325 [Chromatiales bacterium (ex Bugula neritina AB1)]|nr:hypothetical protein AB833_13325 [Chromatiales bacterium (ex Bugula neritina AB1)]
MTEQLTDNHSRDTPHLPGEVWLLTAVVAIVGSNSLLLGPIAPDIAADLSVSVNSVLGASANFGLGTATSAFFLARFIDRFGARTVLCTAIIILLCAFILSTLSQTVSTLLAAQFVAGLAAGLALPASYASAASISPPHQESRVLGIVLTGWTISLVAGVSLSAILADLIHWRAVFNTLAAIAVVVLVLLLRSSLPNRQSQNGTSTPFTALRVSGVPLLLFFVTCYMAAFYGVYNFVGDHVVQTLGRTVGSNAWIAFSYGCGFGLATLLDPLLDRLLNNHSGGNGTARFTRNQLAAIALALLTALYTVLIWASADFFTLVSGAFIWGGLNHLGLNILIAALNSTDSSRRGAIMGVYSGITYLSMSLGTVAFAAIYSRADFQTLCLFAAALTLLAAIIAWLSSVEPPDQKPLP